MVAAMEGLNALLDKNPIVPTYKALDLPRLPETVEATYEYHVRSYVPLSRGVGEDERVDINDFERRLFQLLGEARTPIGYVAAEYGHGKTSTGLFLWERARARNVLAVPPFSLDRLEDLITAVSGWVKFEVERMRPHLGGRADAISERYRAEGVEALAHHHAGEFDRPYEDVLLEFRRLDALDKLQTDADGLTYVNFLGEMTDLAKEAGFDGLLVVMDELQQYIEHADVSSAAEPIGRLFDLITTMLSRTGRLACGLIFLLPNKELGLLNQQRGDLVQRIKANRLALDLTQLYTATFAGELWDRLAETFHFSDIKDRVITADALDALGEIAARTDLASGPRTVIDVLKIVCERFRSDGDTPYDVLDLIGSFERGQVAFDGLSRIQGAVRQTLSHELVRGRPEAERAVRLMAAFPTTGLSVERQERSGLRATVDDLTRLAGGELVAIRGGGYDHTGHAIDAGVTLIALRPAQEQVTWLKATIREFRRGYFLGSDSVHRLAAQAFGTLLTSRLFPAPHWKVECEFESTPISQNQALLLHGAFPSAARRFPERTVYVRILRPDEPPRNPLAEHDLLIDIVLLVSPEAVGNPEGYHTGVLSWIAPNHARVDLNLLHRAADATYLDLSPGFEDIVAPYDVNPLLTLALHAHLAHLVETGAVPGAEESNVRDLFLPALHTAALRDLLHAELGQTAQPPIGAADTRFFEELVLRLCEGTYGDGYVTLMATPPWRNALAQYRGALERIDDPFIQNGNQPLETTKRQLAELFTRTNTGLDNFIEMFPHLIKVETSFRGENEGRVRFTLHPLEQRVVEIIQGGTQVQRRHQRSNQVMTVPTVPVAEISAELAAAGYRMTEIDAGLHLLEARRMIELDQRTGTVVLSEPDIPSLDVIQAAVRELDRRFKRLRPGLSEPAARMLDGKVASLVRALHKPERPLRGEELLSSRRTLDQVSVELEQEVQQQRRALAQSAGQLHTQQPVDPTIGTVLAQPVDDTLFGGQLNAVRVRLQEEAQALIQQGGNISVAAQEALTLLSKPSATDADLLRASATERKAVTAYQSLIQRREQLQRRWGEYRVAAQLLADADALLTDKLVPLGDGVDEQQSAFHEWRRWVTGQLAEGRDNALDQTGAWQERLGAIKLQVSAHEQALRAAFVTRQDTLRAILTDHLQRRADLLPLPLAFNPADPEESERLLVERTRAELDDARDRLFSQFENIASLARDQSRPEKLASLPAERREQASADMRAVELQVQAMAANAANAFAALSDALQSAGPEELARHAQAITALAPPVAALFARVQALTRELQAVALTAEEIRAAAALQEVAGDGPVDLATFEQQLRHELPDADTWAMLEALVRKSRARVRIELISD